MRTILSPRKHVIISEDAFIVMIGRMVLLASSGEKTKDAIKHLPMHEIILHNDYLKSRVEKSCSDISVFPRPSLGNYLPHPRPPQKMQFVCFLKPKSAPLSIQKYL